MHLDAEWKKGETGPLDPLEGLPVGSPTFWRGPEIKITIWTAYDKTGTVLKEAIRTYEAGKRALPKGIKASRTGRYRIYPVLITLQKTVPGPHRFMGSVYVDKSRYLAVIRFYLARKSDFHDVLSAARGLRFLREALTMNDRAGNVLAKNQQGSNPISMTYDGANQLVTSLQGTNLTSHTFDHDGNMTVQNLNGSLTTYSYDPENRLTGYNAAGQLSTYSYAGDGLRRNRQDPGGSVTLTIWDGSNYLQGRQ